MLVTQLKYDLKMFFRELFYLVFTVIMPPASYVFMGQLFDNKVYGDNLNYVQFYTPSFIILITFSVVFFAFGFDQVMNRSLGIEKRISVAPVNAQLLLMSNILKSIIITSLGFTTILIIGMTVYDLSLEWKTLLFSYLAFIGINAILLTISSAIYSFFNEMKSALVFSIVIFQVVMFTGDFTMPIASSPKFVQYIAKANPVYHINHIFIDIWNQMFELNSKTVYSIAYVIVVFLIALGVIVGRAKKQRG
ncbi:ABC transporter permease [Bacillus anthracis]|uniref:ABC transporter permease n=2 Tax=Bacillus cereus group TaxID=86661 RepID=A0A2B3YK43_BACAN|nr:MULTISPECIES: ABC transporter permease [Bacillus]AJI04346.1 ABC-2 type transporter family protein [Bacillus cereus G9241]EDX66457.1 ABC-2 type transporter [Bacillus cereus NVH0597-99]MRB22225.1 ABC transporter permease [Bacillus thuringiensis]AIY74620.1 ABC-2 type transporter family protein [Bacillus cereus]AJG95087.1 ABC-2 type transporter family protein [Bacillus cereus]